MGKSSAHSCTPGTWCSSFSESGRRWDNHQETGETIPGAPTLRRWIPAYPCDEMWKSSSEYVIPQVKCLHMAMDQYLFPTTKQFTGMNIHLPAILMWTTGVPRFWPNGPTHRPIWIPTWSIISDPNMLVVWNMTGFMTFHILGMSSSQLTNSYFSEGLKPLCLADVQGADWWDSIVGAFAYWAMTCGICTMI